MRWSFEGHGSLGWGETGVSLSCDTPNFSETWKEQVVCGVVWSLDGHQQVKDVEREIIWIARIALGLEWCLEHGVSLLAILTWEPEMEFQ